MARSVNKVILIGNVGQDPDVRFTASGAAVANLSLATTDSWKDKNTGQKQERTEWHRLVVFNRMAEVVQQYVQKGHKLYVEGQLQTRKWQDQNGQDRYTTEIVVKDLQMLSGGQQGGQQGGGYGQQGGQQYQPPMNQQRPQGGQQRPMMGPDGRPDTPQRNEAPMPGNQGGFDDFDDEIPF